MRIFLFLPSPLAVIVACCLSTATGCVLETTPDSPEHITERLISLLQDSQPDTRRTAAMALGKISHPKGISALVSALSDPDEEVRQWSAWALGNQANSLPRQALISLVQHVADPADAVRETVVRALSQSEISEELLKVVGEASSISTPATQLTIIQTLAQFEFPFSYPLFIQALQSQDPLIRQYAIVGLAELRDPRGLRFLSAHLLQDPNVGVRVEAAFRLGKIGGPTERSVLRQARETDSTPNVHLWATWSLTQINDEI